jgi:hypothetical protein
MAKNDKLTKLHINLTVELRERLRKAKRYPKESWSDTIAWLLDEHDGR